MSTRKEVKAAAAALRDHAARVAEYHSADRRGPHYGTVLDVDPITVEVHDVALVLEEEDVTLCQQVRIYDRDVGIEQGDTFVMHEMADGDWVATAILSETDI